MVNWSRREPTVVADEGGLPERDRVHAEERRALRRLQNGSRVWAMLSAVLLITCGALAIAGISLYSSSNSSDKVRAVQQTNDLLQQQLDVEREQVATLQQELELAQKQLRTQCGFYLNLARQQDQLTAKTTAFGFQLILTARGSYTGLGCEPDYGRLPKPNALLGRYVAKDGGG
jgi:type II secretory pathway pseudopilin PulG